jgi:hypothetical protein
VPLRLVKTGGVTLIKEAATLKGRLWVDSGGSTADQRMTAPGAERKLQAWFGSGSYRGHSRKHRRLTLVVEKAVTNQVVDVC